MFRREDAPGALHEALAASAPAVGRDVAEVPAEAGEGERAG